MKMLASDEVWQKICWKGSETKVSFTERFATIKKMISDVCAETFKECPKSFIELKMKTFIRHTSERVKRKVQRNTSN